MFCSHCGKEIPKKEMLFCAYCGAPVEQLPDENADPSAPAPKAEAAPAPGAAPPVKLSEPIAEPPAPAAAPAEKQNTAAALKTPMIWGYVLGAIAAIAFLLMARYFIFYIMREYDFATTASVAALIGAVAAVMTVLFMRRIVAGKDTWKLSNQHAALILSAVLLIMAFIVNIFAACGGRDYSWYLDAVSYFNLIAGIAAVLLIFPLLWMVKKSPKEPVRTPKPARPPEPVYTQSAAPDAEPAESVKCKSCGAEMPEGAQHCGMCGASL